jgi:protoporphyrinogen oxidase
MEEYDSVIIGGGISGLYLAHKLRALNKRILLLEKYRVGGRINTVHKSVEVDGKLVNVHYESGAGRFSRNHTSLIKLLEELGLSEKIGEITDPHIYIGKDAKFNNPLTGNEEEITFDIMAKLLEKAFENPPADLWKKTLYEHLADTYGEKIASLLRNIFGYDAEFNLGSAAAMMYVLKKEKFFNQQYYYLNGGLSQITNKLAEELKDYIREKHKVINIDENNNITVRAKNYPVPQYTIKAKTIYICTNTRDISKIIRINDPNINAIIDAVAPASLNRTFVLYDSSTLDPLYNNVISTNLPCRMIIPYGTIGKYKLFMFYNDTKFADRYKLTPYMDKELLKKCMKKLEKDINNQTSLLYKEKTGINKTFPLKKICGVEYWDVGVHLWQPIKESNPFSRYGNNYFKAMNNYLYQPGKKIYFCNEAFATAQEWIESSLENIDKLFQ